jgi:hypothetical protein
VPAETSVHDDLVERRRCDVECLTRHVSTNHRVVGRAIRLMLGHLHRLRSIGSQRP